MHEGKEKNRKDLSLEEMMEECQKHGKKVPDCLIIREKMEEMDEEEE